MGMIGCAVVAIIIVVGLIFFLAVGH
jgi:hypothetical protein